MYLNFVSNTSSIYIESSQRGYYTIARKYYGWWNNWWKSNAAYFPMIHRFYWEKVKEEKKERN